MTNLQFSIQLTYNCRAAMETSAATHWMLSCAIVQPGGPNPSRSPLLQLPEQAT